MHSVFLHHARQAGMGMAIMNPATAMSYDSIPAELRDNLTAVILNTSPTATEQLLEYVQTMQVTTTEATTKSVQQAHSPAEGLYQALLSGTSSMLSDDLHQLLAEGRTPLDIISGPLMDGMNEVGRRFGEGRTFQPQVVKTARTMKQAVDILAPYMTSGDEVPRVGRILLATVKGDVHDIGKNIVGIVLACNGFEVIDLGVMVPSAQIVSEAISQKVDVVCLSGLITPSLDEMCHVARAMQEAGLRIPLFVGGATTSALHTAVRIAPLYGGGVFHLRDAAQNPGVALSLIDPTRREAVLESNRNEQQRLRLVHQSRQQQHQAATERITSDAEAHALSLRFQGDWAHYEPAPVPFMGQQLHEPFALSLLAEHIDWNYFYHAWRVKPDSPEAKLLRRDAEDLLAELSADESYHTLALTAFYPAQGQSDAINVRLRSSVHAPNCPCCNRTIRIPTPRQSVVAPDGSARQQCLSLCDFVAPESDHIGVFAVTVSPAFVTRLETLKADGRDDYATLLLQTLCDRLAEATSTLLAAELSATGWNGIRPAVGYPSLPDQRAMFLLAELLDLKALGITLTENGAMYPLASVAGLYIAHPDSSRIYR